MSKEQIAAELAVLRLALEVAEKQDDAELMGYIRRMLQRLTLTRCLTTPTLGGFSA